MRKNTREVFNAWMMRKPHKSNASIWTDGESIFSYRTILVQIIDGVAYFNRSRYSPTTSNHQSGLAFFLGDEVKDCQVQEIVDIPRGTNDLRIL